MRRILSQLACCIALLILHIASAATPNIVLIFSDNQGVGDVSCFGGDIPTPHIDSIARNGIRFENWYSASSICTPSRFSLMTGQYPNRSQDKLMSALMFLNAPDAVRGIRPHETTLAQVLKNKGYRTAIIGKWHLGHGDVQFLPTRHGFDSFYGFTGGCIDYFRLRYGNKPCWYRDEELVEEQGYVTELLGNEAVAFLKKQQRSKPFFLYLPFNAPHYGKGWDEERKRAINVLQPDEKYLARVQHISPGRRRDYAATVVALDEAIGRVLETLREQKLEKDTLVLFISDNGADVPYGGDNGPFRGKIADIFEGGIRVPAAVQWPGEIKAGQVSLQLASTLDVFPTICRLAGVKTKSLQLDGIDISPVLLKGRVIQRDLFWQMSNGAGAYRQADWKYVRSEAGEDFLFDVVRDIGEERNMAAEHPEVLQRLKKKHAAILSDL